MNKTYTMTETQLDEILDVCKSVPYLIAGGMLPLSTQERANSAWSRLGDELGFDYMTVRPVSGQPQAVFTADERGVLNGNASVPAAEG